jgi:hypothetical protein
MATKKNKTTVFTTNYVYGVYGGGLKVGLCYVTTGATHPETALEELKKFYGNEIKGYYCKTVDSLETISASLKKELMDKTNHSDYLFEVKVTDIKKIIKTVADSKTGSTMGPIKVKETKEDDDESDEEEDEKPEPAKKASKETKAKDEKPKETKAKDEKEKKVEPAKKVTKEVKETKKADDKKKVTKEEVKTNKTVIQLSDDSDDDEEED